MTVTDLAAAVEQLTERVDALEEELEKEKELRRELTEDFDHLQTKVLEDRLPELTGGSDE